MAFQPGAMLYTQAFGSRPENVEVPHYDTRAPTTSDVLYPNGKFWLWPANGLWYLSSISSSQGVTTANWVALSDSDGPVESVLGTTNQVTVTSSQGVATVSLPSAITAPGSLATTSTLTAGTGLTVTSGGAAITGTTTINTSGAGVTTIGTGGTGATNIGNATGNTAVTGSLTASTTLTATNGNITATAGNFVSSTAGNGLSFNANTATGAAASPVVLNSRAGQVVFTSVSIAAAADLTLTITNSQVTASTTQVICDVSGATTGSAISIKSKTSSTGSLALVITNGTGATTTTSDITVTFLVVN